MLLHLKSLLLPAVREGDEEDDDDEHDDGDKRPQDHGEALPPLHLVLDLGLGQELDGLAGGLDQEVERVAAAVTVLRAHVHLKNNLVIRDCVCRPILLDDPVPDFIVMGRQLVQQLLDAVLLAHGVDVGHLVVRQRGEVEVDLHTTVTVTLL